MRLRSREVFVSLTLLVAPALAAGQTAPVEAGVKVGVNMATMTVSFDGDKLANDYRDNRTGIVLGGFVAKTYNGSVGLQVEALFSQRGVSFAAEGETAEFRVNYFDVPVLARIGTTTSGGARLSALVGPTVSMKINRKLTLNNRTEAEDYDDTSSVDLGLTFGGSVEIQRFIAEARYTLGLKDIDKDPSDVIKNRTLSLLVGYRFK
jgi:hypothetical protein